MTPGIAPSPDSIQLFAIQIILGLGEMVMLSYLADKCEQWASA